MARFHPHGDTAIYDALARMVQDFSLRHPLIDGHGEFGSPSPNDGPAAMRYTECRLAQLTMSMLEGLDERTVDFTPNFSGTDDEPVVLPARFPNLLVNGSQGIAVGMATNIPPHNLGEVIDATTYLLEHPDATPDELMQFVKGPDFRRRADSRPFGDPRRLPHRARLGPSAGGRGDRRRAQHHPDRRHRSSVPDRDRIDRPTGRGRA